MVALGLHCFAQASSGGERGCSSLLCVGFLFQWHLLLLSSGSRVQGLEKLQLTGSSAWRGRRGPSRGMWDPPGPGVEPTSSALAGFLSTAPPGKSPVLHFLVMIISCGDQVSNECMAGFPGTVVKETPPSSSQ